MGQIPEGANPKEVQDFIDFNVLSHGERWIVRDLAHLIIKNPQEPTIFENPFIFRDPIKKAAMDQGVPFPLDSDEAYLASVARYTAEQGHIKYQYIHRPISDVIRANARPGERRAKVKPGADIASLSRRQIATLVEENIDEYPLENILRTYTPKHRSALDKLHLGLCLTMEFAAKAPYMKGGNAKEKDLDYMKLQNSARRTLVEAYIGMMEKGRDIWISQYLFATVFDEGQIGRFLGRFQNSGVRNFTTGVYGEVMAATIFNWLGWDVKTANDTEDAYGIDIFAENKEAGDILAIQSKASVHIKKPNVLDLSDRNEWFTAGQWAKQQPNSQRYIDSMKIQQDYCRSKGYTPILFLCPADYSRQEK